MRVRCWGYHVGQAGTDPILTERKSSQEGRCGRKEDPRILLQNMLNILKGTWKVCNRGPDSFQWSESFPWGVMCCRDLENE